MNAIIDIFRGPDFAPAGNLPVLDVIRVPLERLLGRSLQHERIKLLLLTVPDEDAGKTKPEVINLMPQIGYAGVVVEDGERILYRHPHTVEELIAEPLREILQKQHPDVPSWGFAFRGIDVPRRVVRPEPVVQGMTAVTPLAEGEALPFGIRRLPEPPLPEASLAELGVSDPGKSAGEFVKVLVPRSLAGDLTQTRQYSPEVEEGGFLIGDVHEDREAPNTHIVKVTAALNAEHTGASLLHFTFTGDSFDAVKQSLRRDHPGKRLLGWYHTHLFAATDEMGLSSIDLRLHFTTFRQPWQLAGLVNLDGTQRILRFYVRQGDTMHLCPLWVIDERS